MGRSGRGIPALLGLVALAVGAVVAWQGLGTPQVEVPGDGAVTETPADELLATAPLGGDARAKTAPRPAGTGALEVRVLRAPDLAPVADAPVILRGTRAEGTPTSRIGWTDDLGRAVVEAVPAGPWDVRIQPSADPPVDRAGVEIRDGETTVLPDVILVAAGVVDGVVFDASFEPLANVDVVATLDPDVLRGTDDDPWPPTTDVPFAFARRRTDDRGRFRLEGVPPGLVAVRVAGAGWRGATDRVLVPPEPPRTGWVRFVLRPGHGLFGTIAGLDGKPVEKARVEMGTRPHGVFVPRLAAETDAEGRFAVAGFGALAGADLLVTPARGAVTAFDGVPLDTDVRLTIGAGTGARVRVTVLSAEAKRPIEGAFVRLPLRPRAAGVWHVGRVDHTTDERGMATADAAPGTVVECDVVHPRFRPARVRVTHDGRVVKEGWPVAGDVARPLAQDEERGIAVFLRPPLRVRGRVVEASGTPIGRARVTLTHAVLRDPVTEIADTEGRFTFAEVVPEYGASLVAASPRGVRSGVTSLATPRDDETTWPEVRLEVPQAGCTLEGTVVDPAGRPVAGARVRSETGSVARTDDAGRYRLVGIPWTSGRGVRSVTVTATAEGVGWGVAVAQVGRDAPAQAPDLRLGRGVDVRGVVTRPNGDRARFPVLEVRSLAAAEPIRTSCGEEFGDFVLRSLPPGSWHVRARVAGLAGAAIVTLDRDREPGFTPIRLAPIWEVALRTVDAVTGEPVEGFSVRLTGMRGSVPDPLDRDATLERRHAVTGPDGRALLSTQSGTPTSVRLDLERSRRWGKAVGGAQDYRGGEVDLPEGADGLVVEVSERERPRLRGDERGWRR